MRCLIALLAAMLLVGCSSAAVSPPSVVPTTLVATAQLPSVVVTVAPEPTSAPEPTTIPTTEPTVPPAPTAALEATTIPPTSLAQEAAPLAFDYPIRWPNRAPGDGFFMRHGFQTENTWYNPGYWHTGEDWYAQNDQDTAGAEVLAIAAGTVVYADANYPGRVVIIQHADDLYSMYGHLDPSLNVAVGDQVERGTLLGQVLRRSDDVPNHLHFELRTFLTTSVVNGDTPRYDFRCGRNCPPGPGYWPINAPDLPSAVGYLNPVHTINRRAFATEATPIGAVLVPAQPVSQTLTLWSAPPGGQPPTSLGEVTLTPGTTFALLAVDAGEPATTETSAESYHLWYQVVLPDERSGWLQAAVSSPLERGNDGRASSVSFNLLPALSLVSGSS